MLRGFEPIVNLPKLQLSGNRRELSSMFLFGVSYAVASLSCTIGVFIAVTSTTLTNSSFGRGRRHLRRLRPRDGSDTGGAHDRGGAGQAGSRGRFRSLLPHIHTISGVLLILAGIFVTYYAWVEVQELNGEGSSAIVDRTRDIQSSLQRWAEQQGAARLLLAAVIIIGAAVAISVLLRRNRSARSERATPRS